MRAGSAVAIGLALLMPFAAGRDLSAHRLDEYLQAARIDLRANGVVIDLNLTPGTAVAESIITMIDRDRDGMVSASEQLAYAGEVVSALEVSVDGEPMRLRVVSAEFPAAPAFRRGEGTVRLQASATHRSLTSGAHQMFFRNTHLGAESVYLANALVPDDDRVSVTGQRRDGDQRELTIDYHVRAPSAEVAPWLLFSVVAGVATAWFHSSRDPLL
jgi:hypothetical protein